MFNFICLRFPSLPPVYNPDNGKKLKEKLIYNPDNGEKLKEKLKIEKIYYFLYNSKEFDDLVCMEK